MVEMWRRGEEGEERRILTLLAVGWMYPSLTVLAVLVTVDVNHPNPFVIAATESFCHSSNGTPPSPPPPAAGAGVLPNPAYLPP